MTKPVKLSDILEAMEFQSEDYPTCLDRDTGRIVHINADIDYEARGDKPLEKLPEWMRDDVRDARRIEADEGDYVGLPDRFEIDEYDMMREFALSREDADVSGQLLDAISGTGAFRMFKSTVRRLGIEKAWYGYRDEAYKRLAREWCDENKVPYTED